METVTIHKAKTQTQLSRLIEKACRGEDVVIARGSKPVVRLVAETGRIERKDPDRPGILRAASSKGIGALAVATSSSEYFRQLWRPATLVTVRNRSLPNSPRPLLIPSLS